MAKWSVCDEEEIVKRLGVIGVALAALVIPAVAVADRAAITKLTGTAEWSGGTLADSTTTTLIHGTFVGKLGEGSYEGTLIGGAPFTTTTCGPVCQPVTGTITFSAHRGSFTGVVQPGSLVALTNIASHSWRAFTLALGVTGGTRSYRHANGVLALSYTSTWTHTFIGGVFINSISDTGTLTGALQRRTGS